MSGRNLHRYFRIVRTSREVQDAYRAGRLSLVNAGRVAGLDAATQEEIAAEIRQGGDSKEIVARYLPAPAERAPETLGDCFRRFRTACERANSELAGRVGEIGCWAGSEAPEVLRATRKLIDNLLPQLKRTRAEERKKMDATQARMEEE
jgi:hypothetical protein